MLRTRLLMGTVLTLSAVAILVADSWLAPWYPCLAALTLVASLLACRELLWLLPDGPRPWVCLPGVGAVLLANWPAHVGLAGSPWLWVLATFTCVFLVAFLTEAHYFTEPGRTVVRLSQTLFVVAYVGLLASFFVQLRWRPGGHGVYALALAIFVPKGCDIGAYVFGRLFGRHRFAPILSPKKSWEGTIGGVLTAVAVACGINALSGGADRAPMLTSLAAAAFGLVVGTAGTLGDLMESLIKRDCGRKDASDVVPGFGGVLDVLDSVIFSAPVSYLFLLVVGRGD